MIEKLKIIKIICKSIKLYFILKKEKKRCASIVKKIWIEKDYMIKSFQI